MFPKYALLFAVALLFQPARAATITSREDVTREVYIPDGETLTKFCGRWKDKCVDLAHREGKASDVCSAGYDGAGTARVDCLAQTSNPTAADYTDRVAKALHVSFVVA